MHRKASFKKHLSIKYFCKSKREADDENSMILEEQISSRATWYMQYDVSLFYMLKRHLEASKFTPFAGAHTYKLLDGCTSTLSLSSRWWIKSLLMQTLKKKPPENAHTKIYEHWQCWYPMSWNQTINHSPTGTCSHCIGMNLGFHGSKATNLHTLVLCQIYVYTIRSTVIDIWNFYI